MDLFSKILVITLPVFTMVFMGLALRKWRLIDEPFIKVASNLTFRATMPTLFFLSTWRADLSVAFNAPLVGAFALCTIVGFGLSWWWATRTVEYSDRGVFVQGAFRGNCGVLSFALAVAYFGDFGRSTGGVLVGITIIIFNLLAVFILSIYSSRMKFSMGNLFKEIFTNPLIIAVVLGLTAGALHMPIPDWIVKSAEYFSGLTLPLALICVGGTLGMESIRSSGKSTLEATVIKIIMLPMLGVAVGKLVGLNQDEQLMLWMFLASPTAAGSFSMAMAAGSDGKLAANVIALSTLVSTVTMTAGIYWMS